MYKLEFLMIDSKTGEIKYRNRRTMSLSPDAFPEKQFDLWMKNILAVFRQNDNPKYANIICQFSCKKCKKEVQGTIIPTDLIKYVSK